MNKLIFLICLSLIACGNQKKIKAINYSQGMASNATIKMPLDKTQHSSYNEDSSKIINAIYKGLQLLPEALYYGFSFTFNYNPSTRIIVIYSKDTIENNILEYQIKLFDKNKIFSKATFDPSDDYQYMDSYFYINGTKFDLGKMKVYNENENIAPVIIWYGKDFGPALKYVKYKNRDIFLIRGLNFYCNGSNCTDYLLFIIQKYDGKYSLNCIQYPGYYPFNFENTFVINAKNNPEIYYVKRNMTKIMGISSFKKYSIKFSTLY